jgi:YVTN family beta-propeller protein
MSSVKFGGSFSFITSATPSIGWVVGYDTDGILKQKDSNGIITPIGGGPTAGNSATYSLSQVLSAGNNSNDYSIIMGTSTYIKSNRGGGQLNLDYLANEVLLSTDNAAFSASQLYLKNGYIELSDYSIGSRMNLRSEKISLVNGTTSLPTGNGIIINSSISNGKIYIGVSTDDIKITATQGASNTTTNNDKYGVILSSRNSYFSESSRNSVILGGANIFASQNNSVYTPDLYIQDGKSINGTLGNGNIRITSENDLIITSNGYSIGIVSSTSSQGSIDNGFILVDSASIYTSSSNDSANSIISSKEATVFPGVVNSAAIGGSNLDVSDNDTVYLGNYVNINNAYTLPNVDGTAGYVLKTDGSGNVSWQSDGGASIPTLYEVLNQGNNSNTKSIIMGTGTYIKSSNGGGRIDLDLSSGANQLLISNDNASFGSSYILLNNGDLEIQSTNLFNLLIKSGDVTVSDGDGLKYTSNYSSGFVDRSLIDKGYVDSGTSSIWSRITNIVSGTANQNYVTKWKSDNSLSEKSSIYIDDISSAYVVKNNITSGTSPNASSFDSQNERIYVINEGSNNVSIIDTSNYNIIGTVSIGTNPVDITFDSKNNRMYVTNAGSDNVSVINTSTNTISSTISVGNYPTGIEFDSVNDLIYVSNQLDNKISVIDTTSNVISATISITSPNSLSYNWNNNKLYVSGASNDVRVVDVSLNTITATISVGTNPTGLEYDSNNNRIYVTNNSSDNVTVINSNNNSVISTISVGSAPDSIKFDKINNKIYVSNTGDATISVIDTQTNAVISIINASNVVNGLSYDSVNQKIYASNTSDDSIDIINTYNKSNEYVGILTNDPTSELDVRGKITTNEIKIKDGAYSGYNLISDSYGNASWQPRIIQVSSGTGLTGSGTYGVVSLSVDFSVVSSKSYVDSGTASIWNNLATKTSKYSITRGFTASTTETITHNLGTDEVIIQSYDSSGIMITPGTVQINGLNSVDLTFSHTLSGVKIVIIG